MEIRQANTPHPSRTHTHTRRPGGVERDGERQREMGVSGKRKHARVAGVSQSCFQSSHEIKPPASWRSADQFTLPDPEEVSGHRHTEGLLGKGKCPLPLAARAAFSSLCHRLDRGVHVSPPRSCAREGEQQPATCRSNPRRDDQRC